MLYKVRGVTKPRLTFEPFSLSIKQAASYFGLAEDTFYHWISEGRLHRGHHYIKVGRKNLIVREAFIKWLREQDGSIYPRRGAVS